jgi:lipopolysaccharide biosynthesis glycosyltransferase
MISRCACFLTDIGYLFPSLLCAIQARKFLDRESADVIITLFDSTPKTTELFSKICNQNGIILICADREILGGHSAMYARLFLSQILPEKYQRVLYLDGDMQIGDTLNDLIQTELPANCDFAAAPDPMAIELYESKSDHPNTQSYFDGLGINSTPERPYLNSGALLINRAQWAGIGRDALDYLAKSPATCRFQDQSALNFVGHSRYAPMSFRWNFPIFFKNCGVESAIAPRIFHFMSKPKPWDGVFLPWNRSFVEPYAKLIAEYPELQAYSKKMPLSAHMKYLGQQYYKCIYETITWRFSGRRPAILEFEAATRF